MHIAIERVKSRRIARQLSIFLSAFSFHNLFVDVVTIQIIHKCTMTLSHNTITEEAARNTVTCPATVINLLLCECLLFCFTFCYLIRDFLLF